MPAKLSEDAVRFIRGSKASHRELARIFGVSDVAIYYVRARMTWKHVE